jgi:hypothetical protein
MPTYEDLLELARICAHNALLPGTTPAVAAELWARAAQLNRGNLPDIGLPSEFNQQR